MPKTEWHTKKYSNPDYSNTKITLYGPHLRSRCSSIWLRIKLSWSLIPISLAKNKARKPLHILHRIAKGAKVDKATREPSFQHRNWPPVLRATPVTLTESPLIDWLIASSDHSDVCPPRPHGSAPPQLFRLNLLNLIAIYLGNSYSRMQCVSVFQQYAFIQAHPGFHSCLGSPEKQDDVE